VNLGFASGEGELPCCPGAHAEPVAAPPYPCQPPFVPVVTFKAFSDDDLAGVVDGGYSPDKKKGKQWPTSVRPSALAVAAQAIVTVSAKALATTLRRLHGGCTWGEGGSAVGRGQAVGLASAVTPCAGG